MTSDPFINAPKPPSLKSIHITLAYESQIISSAFSIALNCNSAII